MMVDVSWFRTLDPYWRRSFFTLLSKLCHTVYFSPVPLATTQNFISSFLSTHRRLHAIAEDVCFDIDGVFVISLQLY